VGRTSGVTLHAPELRPIILTIVTEHLVVRTDLARAPAVADCTLGSLRVKLLGAAREQPHRGRVHFAGCTRAYVGRAILRLMNGPIVERLFFVPT
jgi:hypothetical protein